MSSEPDNSSSYLRHHRSIENTFEHHSQRNMSSVSFTSSNGDTRTISSPPNGAPIIIGRASNVKSLPLPHPNHPTSHNLIFNCPVMSKTHAELCWVQHQPFIKDTGSTHGTWVKSNGSLLRLKPDRPHKLENGMAIRFGKIIGTGPQNDRERHYPIEVTVKISKTSGTYGLTDQLLTSSDELSENEAEEQDEEGKEDDEEEEQCAIVDPQIGSREELALRRQYLTHDHSGSVHSHSDGEEAVSDEEEENSQYEREEEAEVVEPAEDEEDEGRHAEDSMVSNPLSEHSTDGHMTLAADAHEDTDQPSSVNEDKLLMDESIHITDDPSDIDSSRSDSDEMHQHSNISSVVDHEQDIESDNSNTGIEVTAVQVLRSDSHPADDQSIVISESEKETRHIATCKQPLSSSAQSKSTDLQEQRASVNVCSEPPSTSPTDSNESNATSQQAERLLPHSPRPIIPIRRMPRAEEQLINTRSLEAHSERSQISTGIQTDLMADGQVVSNQASDDVVRPRIRYQSDGTFTTFAVDYHVAPVRCKRGREEEKMPTKISEESEGNSGDEEDEVSQEKEEVEVEEDHAPKKRKLTGFIPSVKSLAIFALGGVATVAGILAFEDI